MGFSDAGKSSSGFHRASGRPESHCQNKNELLSCLKVIVRKKSSFWPAGRPLGIFTMAFCLPGSLFSTCDKRQDAVHFIEFVS
jgi:hypothetical protein